MMDKILRSFPDCDNSDPDNCCYTLERGGVVRDYLDREKGEHRENLYQGWEKKENISIGSDVT